MKRLQEESGMTYLRPNGVRSETRMSLEHSFPVWETVFSGIVTVSDDVLAVSP
jgi:hypothetical protein